MSERGSWFRRWLLPAFAFKAVVIGGGYATGREIAEFFLPNGPWGGLLGMILAAALWSVVCMMSFLFARASASLDYQSFFKSLLGRFGVVFEIAYAPFLVLVLAVFGAAAGAIGQAALGWPTLVGACLLATLIALVTAFGNTSVERLFKYVSIFLYATYAVLVLCVSRFGGPIQSAFTTPQPIGHGWALGGLTYAGYNIIGAVVILPVVRHMTSNRDAVIAGLVCGPLAMAPAIVFFICMAAFTPGIQSAALPSDVLLQRLDLPIFRLVFQAMIFLALLESGTGLVNAVVERIAHTWSAARPGQTLSPRMRLLLAAVVLVVSIFLAGRFGLVTLIAKGYPVLAWVFLAIYVAPLLTIGVMKLRGRRAAAA